LETQGGRRLACIAWNEAELCEPGSILHNRLYGVEAVVVRRLYGTRYLVIPKYLEGARLLETYAATQVASAARRAGLENYIPEYSITAPVVDVRETGWLCCQSYGPHVAQLLGTVAGTLGGLLEGGCVGLTGSLLAGHWSSAYSDIDLLVDTSPACLRRSLDRFIEATEPLPPEDRRRWLLREARSRGVELEALQGLVTRWQRRLLGGRQVSLAPLSRRLRLQPERRLFRPQGGWECIRFCSEGGSEALGDYPAVVHGDGGACVVLYDGFYIPALIEGGCFRACGPRVVVVGEPGRTPSSCIAVGGREGGLLVRL
jgi:hypothetical protein